MAKAGKHLLVKALKHTPLVGNHQKVYNENNNNNGLSHQRKFANFKQIKVDYNKIFRDQLFSGTYVKQTNNIKPKTINVPMKNIKKVSVFPQNDKAKQYIKISSDNIDYPISLPRSEWETVKTTLLPYVDISDVKFQTGSDIGQEISGFSGNDEDAQKSSRNEEKLDINVEKHDLVDTNNAITVPGALEDTRNILKNLKGTLASLENTRNVSDEFVSKVETYIDEYEDVLTDTKNVMSITIEIIKNINTKFKCIDKYIDNKTNKISSEGFNLTDIEVGHLNDAIKIIETKIVNNTYLHDETGKIVERWKKFCKESREITNTKFISQFHNNVNQPKLKVNLAGFVKCAWFLATVMVVTGGGVVCVPAIILSGKYLHDQEYLIKHENIPKLHFMIHIDELKKELKKIKAFGKDMKKNVKDFETKQRHVRNDCGPESNINANAVNRDPTNAELIVNLRQHFKKFAKSQNDISIAVDKIIHDN